MRQSVPSPGYSYLNFIRSGWGLLFSICLMKKRRLRVSERFLCDDTFRKWWSLDFHPTQANSSPLFFPRRRNSQQQDPVCVDAEKPNLKKYCHPGFGRNPAGISSTRAFFSLRRVHSFVFHISEGGRCLQISN